MWSVLRMREWNRKINAMNTGNLQTHLSKCSQVHDYTPGGSSPAPVPEMNRGVASRNERTVKTHDSYGTIRITRSFLPLLRNLPANSSQFGLGRPTRLDEIKNLHIDPSAGPLGRASFLPHGNEVPVLQSSGLGTVQPSSGFRLRETKSKLEKGEGKGDPTQ